MVILHVASLNGNKSAGLTTNVPKNVIFESKYCEVALYNLYNYSFDGVIEKNKVFLEKDYPNISSLPEPFNKPDIVVFQSFYIPSFIKIYKELKNKMIPYTICPRGALTKNAQKKSKYKKIIGNLLFFNKIVKNAKFIHFLTENEYLESKKAFKFNDQVIIGNGFEIPKKKYTIKSRNKFIITYIGRFSVFHKGLDFLVGTVNQKKEWFITNNVEIHLYGNSVYGGIEYLNEFVEKNNLFNIVKLNGPIYGDEKEKALLDSDIFIHTSRLEGHPTGVIEAISYGIPVVVTPGTNMLKEVKENKLGFTCEMTCDDIFNAIKMSFESKNKFKDISKKEIEYANNNYDWNLIAKKTVEDYTQKIKE